MDKSFCLYDESALLLNLQDHSKLRRYWGSLIYISNTLKTRFAYPVISLSE